LTIPQVAGELSPDERAAARAFIARCEVRLSTFHRIAVGLLSGAGILVVLPVLTRDSVTGILRALVTGRFTAVDALLIVATLTILAVPATALWLLFTDLTRFYFHANHLGGGRETFTPRFTLTALRLPSDELGTEATAQLATVRRQPHIVELLVPINDASRTRIDRQLDVYRDVRDAGLDDHRGIDEPDDHEFDDHELDDHELDDHEFDDVLDDPERRADELDRVRRADERRADGLFELAASQSRTLLEEVAKIEHGMARHVLRLRSLVLRYVKAVLAVLAAALAVYAGDAIVADIAAGRGVTAPTALWLAGVGLIWAPAVVLAVTSPVRWIEQLMRDDGAPTTAVADDPELTHIERVSLRIAALGWMSAAVAMVLASLDGDVSGLSRAGGLVTLVASATAVGIAASRGRFRSLIRLF
jgi:hypothetical protein